MSPTAQTSLRLRFLREGREVPDHMIRSTISCTVGKAGTELNLEEYLGRAPLDYVSRRHFTIACDEQGWYIIDHSLNGTWLNGSRLLREQPFPLQDSHIIVLPDVNLSVQIQIHIDGTKPLPIGQDRTYGLCRAHFEDLQYILHRLETFHCAHIAGPAGVGKSVIFDALLKPEIYERMSSAPLLLFCELDLHRMPDYEIDDFYHLVFNNLITKVRMLGTGYEPLVLELEGVLGKLDSVRNMSAYCNYLRQGLDRIGRAARRRVVFVIRHFDIVLRHLETNIIADLVELYRTHAWHPIFVVSTRDSLLHLAVHVNPAELYHLSDMLGTPRWISRLNFEDLTHYLSILVQDPVVTNQEIALLYSMSGGWPSLARAGAFSLRASKPPLDIAYENHVLERFLETEMTRAACTLLWSELPVEEQNVLFELANGSPVDNAQIVARLQTKSLVNLSITINSDVQICSKLFERFIRAVAHRVQTTEDANIFALDELNGTVFLNGRLLRAGPDLSKLEFKLLTYLTRRAGEVCTLNDILDDVYDDEAGEAGGDARIRRLLARLRAKIQPESRIPQLIENVRGIGVRLNVTPRSMSDISKV